MLNKEEMKQSFCGRMPFLSPTSSNHSLDLILSLTTKTPEQGRDVTPFTSALRRQYPIKLCTVIKLNERKMFTWSITPPALAKMFVTRMMTRDLFAIASRILSQRCLFRLKTVDASMAEISVGLMEDVCRIKYNEYYYFVQVLQVRTKVVKLVLEDRL